MKRKAVRWKLSFIPSYSYLLYTEYSLSLYLIHSLTHSLVSSHTYTLIFTHEGTQSTHSIRYIIVLAFHFCSIFFCITYIVLPLSHDTHATESAPFSGYGSLQHCIVQSFSNKQTIKKIRFVRNHAPIAVTQNKSQMTFYVPHQWKRVFI